MISKFARLPALMVTVPLNMHDYDKPKKGYYYPKNDNESGWERIKIMFRTE